MKLYKFETPEGDAKWFGSQVEAKSFRFKSETKKAPISMIEIPTDKKGLLEWLNTKG